MTAFLHSRLVCAAALSLVGPAVSWAQEGFAETEARTALAAALTRTKGLEKDLAAEKEAGQLLATKVGILTAEVATLREELSQAKLLTEALGSAATTERGLEKRILDAVNDLRVMKEEKEALEASLQKLAETVSLYLRAEEEQKPALRVDVDQALATATARGDTQPAPASTARIESSRVVSLKPEHKLVAFNAGQSAGLKVGTPLRIYRNDRPIASAVIIEVRPHVSGGLITGVENDAFPRVGDTLRIDTRTDR